jgi:hypothetical protein
MDAFLTCSREQTIDVATGPSWRDIHVPNMYDRLSRKRKMEQFVDEDFQNNTIPVKVNWFKMKPEPVFTEIFFTNTILSLIEIKDAST